MRSQIKLVLQTRSEETLVPRFFGAFVEVEWRTSVPKVMLIDQGSSLRGDEQRSLMSFKFDETGSGRTDGKSSKVGSQASAGYRRGQKCRQRTDGETRDRRKRSDVVRVGNKKGRAWLLGSSGSDKVP